MVQAMIAGRLHIDPALPAPHALGRGRSLWETRRAAGVPGCTLYAAPFSGSAVVLGAYQHAPQALAADRLGEQPVLRRATGGVAVEGGDGVLYVALGLSDASALMSCPPGRILNRNVRGLLQAGRALGVPAHYFGRDFVSFAGQPGGYVAFAEADDGGVMLELFIGLTRPFALSPELSGYPPPSEPRFRGKPLTSLRQAGARADAREALLAIAQGYAKLHTIVFASQPPTQAELDRAEALAGACRVVLTQDAALTWSRPREEAIGFVSAGVALDARGELSEVVLAGDFMQHDSCKGRLRAALLAGPPESTRVGAALDATYATRPGLIEGVRSLTTLRDAILEAARNARGAT
jgi:lipoate-protein ligase A